MRNVERFVPNHLCCKNVTLQNMLAYAGRQEWVGGGDFRGLGSVHAYHWHCSLH